MENLSLTCPIYMLVPMSLLFLWHAIGILGRRRYLKATGQKMKEIYFHVAVLISGASFFGILYFTAVYNFLNK